MTPMRLSAVLVTVAGLAAPPASGVAAYQTASAAHPRNTNPHLPPSEDRMTSQLHYLEAQQRYSELARSAEQARLANQARLAASASSPRGHIGWLLAPRRLRPGRPAAAARQANTGPPKEGLRCDA
jgi:hypothetical protein